MQVVVALAIALTILATVVFWTPWTPAAPQSTEGSPASASGLSVPSGTSSTFVPATAANLILSGGKVWTGDPASPEAEAVAVQGERILATGASREIEALADKDTRIVALRGRRAVPGLIDAHVHLLEGGDSLLAPDLRSARSEEEFAARLGEAAARLPEGAWIASGSWDHENWPGARLPGREALDRHTPRNPVFVSRLDGHMAVANSLAIRIAGVTAATPDPPGGRIVRDPATGEPAGVFADVAMDLVARHIPPWDERARLERALAAVRHAASLGVTGVHDMGTTAEALRTYQHLRDRNELSLRITAYAPIASLDHWRKTGVRRGFGDAHLKVNGLKAFADGSLGSSTALFLEPYLDDGAARTGGGGNCGLAQSDLSPGGELERSVRAAMESGLQPAVHAIGDRAIREILDIFERVSVGLPMGSRGEFRFRVEHAQHIHPDDLERFGILGITASMQPYHAADDGRWAAKRIGAKRCETTYAFRDLLDRGTRLAFGSDWPVAPLSPMEGIEAAVTRRTLDGKNPDGWIPRQRIRVEEALRAYTAGSAHAAFDEERVGVLRRGWLADIVILSEDILAIDPGRIGEVKVDLTVVGGRVVYER